jgi:hypothetical protein
MVNHLSTQFPGHSWSRENGPGWPAYPPTQRLLLRKREDGCAHDAHQGQVSRPHTHTYIHTHNTHTHHTHIYIYSIHTQTRITHTHTYTHIYITLLPDIFLCRLLVEDKRIDSFELRKKVRPVLSILNPLFLNPLYAIICIKSVLNPPYDYSASRTASSTGR